MSNMTERKWQRVARLIRDDLPQPGNTIDSEAALCEQYGVSRNTVRLALRSLETEGVIVSSPGALRMVRDTKRWTWSMSNWEAAASHTVEADAWAHNIIEQGGEPTTEVRVEMVQAPDHVAEALQVEAGAATVARIRVRSVDGEPHQLSTSYFPRWLTDDNPVFLMPGDQSAPGGLLAASGHPQLRIWDQLGARMPSPDEAKMLNITAMTPLLVHKRTGYDEAGRPVRYMHTLMAADRVLITYDI
jgi:GntR family transcriptional regulator